MSGLIKLKWLSQNRGKPLVPRIGLEAPRHLSPACADTIKNAQIECALSSNKTISAQDKARTINLFHIGSTPYYVSNAYATTMNVIELQEAERAEGFCLIRLWWVLAHNSRHIKQNKTTVVVCSASCKPHKQKKRRLTVVFNLSGSKGIRTPDPLLVRQML